MTGIYLLGGIVTSCAARLPLRSPPQAGDLLMSSSTIVQLALYLGAVLLLMKPLGIYMLRVYEGSPGVLGRLLGPLERLIYRACGVDPSAEMGWRTYALATLLFNLAGGLLLYVILRLQHLLPLNPYGFGALTPDLAFNTAVSFLTNTNWQSYSGENVMSQLSQVGGLMVQHFVCAASAMAVMVALIRGLVPSADRHHRQLLGRPGSDEPLHPPAPLAGARGGAGRAGSAADVRPRRRRDAGTGDELRRPSGRPGRQACQRLTGEARDPEGRGRGAGRPDGPGGGVRGHQAARLERRWLLQRQRGASLREPDTAHQLPRAPRHPAARRGVHLHVQQEGGRHPAGVGAHSHAHRASRASASPSLRWCEQHGNPRLADLGVDQAATASVRAGTWRARRRASAPA